MYIRRLSPLNFAMKALWNPLEVKISEFWDVSMHSRFNRKSRSEMILPSLQLEINKTLQLLIKESSNSQSTIKIKNKIHICSLRRMLSFQIFPKYSQIQKE